MTFAEIADEWGKRPKLPSGRPMLEWGKKFVSDLIAPERRGWFTACHAWVHGGPSPDDYPEEIPQVMGSLGEFGHRLAQVAQAHIDCARHVRKHEHWPSCTVDTTDELRALAASAKLPLGLLRDLARELAARQSQRREPYDVLYGDLRPAGSDRRAELNVLLVEEEQRRDQQPRGGVATLTLEVMPNGDRTLYPAPALAFVDRRGDFCQAEDHALAYVRGRGLWQDTWDVRWRLARHDGELPLQFVGNSLGGALALGLAWVCGTTEASLPWIQRLQALDLKQVAITAAIDPSGNLGPVGALWRKMQAASGVEGLEAQLRAAATMGLLRVVIVAATQSNVPSQLLAPAASPLRVIQAATLEQAVEKLYEEHGPRWAVRQHEREQCAHLEVLDRPVPLERLYQTLPLLREIKPEELPRDPRVPERSEDAENRRHPADLVRWEEEVWSKRIADTREPLEPEKLLTDFRVVARKAASTVPRFVVLGPPGSGKSTLVQYLASQAAQGVLRVAQQHLVPVRVRLRDWEARYPRMSLTEYLTACYKERLAGQEHRLVPMEAHWELWLQRGEVLLLLDGLDETERNAFITTVLKAALSAFTNTPTVLTCRTVSFEQYRNLCPEWPVFILAGLDDSQREAYIRAFPAEYPKRYDRAALITQLNRMSQMRPLAANPLLLSIICYVVDDPQGVDLPATRGELYDKAVERLLTRPPRVDITYPNGRRTFPLIHKRRILERVAYTLFASLEQQRQLTFTEASLMDALTQAAEQEGYTTDRVPVADALLADLTANSGLIRGNPTQGYFFLHLTVQEFLTAVALKRLIDDPRPGGWNARIEGGGKTWTVQELVNKKAWDPRWQEVIVLLAGQLRDPGPLFEILEAQKDDMFRHRLALAALCLPELTPTIRALHDTTVNRITTAAFGVWCEHHRHNTDATVSHLTRTLPALGQVNGHVLRALHRTGKGYIPRPTPDDRDSTPLQEWLVQQLGAKAVDVRQAAAAIGGLGRAATEPILAALVQLLQDDDLDIRQAAAEAVRKLGSAAATEPVLAALAQLLQNSAAHVQRAAAQAVGYLGSAAATEPILAALVQLLQNGAAHVRQAASVAIGGLGRAATEPFLATLVQLLQDDDPDIRQEAAQAVGRLRSAAATEPILAALAQLLQNDVADVQRAAAQAVRELGSAAATEPILAALAQLLQNDAADVQRAAAQAVGRWRSVVTWELRQLLFAVFGEDNHLGVLIMAAEAGERLGSAAVTEPFLAALAQLLQDDDPAIREAAVRAVGSLGSAAVTEPFLAALAQLFQDDDPAIREVAVRAVGRLRSAAVTEPFLAALPRLLQDDDPNIRLAAVGAVGSLRSAAVTELFLAALPRLLQDDDPNIRLEVARAVQALGSAVVTVDIPATLVSLLRDLVSLLRDPDAQVRRRAARQVRQMMEQGIRIFSEQRGRLVMNSVADLRV